MKKISEKVFDNFYAEKKYQYLKFKDYNFFFNQKVDDVTKGNTLYDIGINVITPNSDYSGNESLLMMKSSQEKSVFIDLGENSSYINEIEMDIKIEKFLKSGELEGLPQGSVIKEKKTLERKEHLENSNLLIEEALRNAQY